MHPRESSRRIVIPTTEDEHFCRAIVNFNSGDEAGIGGQDPQSHCILMLSNKRLCVKPNI